MIAEATSATLLKVTDKPFKDKESGKDVPYVFCNLLDDEGNVFENISIAGEIKTKLLGLKTPTVGSCVIEIFNGNSKDGKKFLKMRLVDFTPNK